MESDLEQREREYLSAMVGKVVAGVRPEYQSGEMSQMVVEFTDGTSLVVKSESAGYGGETELDATLMGADGSIA